MSGQGQQGHVQGSSYDAAMGHVNKAVTDVEANPGKCVTYSWYMILFFSLILVIVAIAAAAENDGSGSSGTAFAAVWVLIVVIAVSAIGTYILRKFHTALAVGTFLGMTSMMSQMMFILFLVFLAEARGGDGNDKNGDQAMSAFCFIMCVLYAIFSIILSRYRSTVMGPKASEEAANQEAVGQGWSNEGTTQVDEPQGGDPM